MKILVFANDTSWNELIAGSTSIEWIRAENIGSFVNREEIDAYFNLSENITETGHSFFNHRYDTSEQALNSNYAAELQGIIPSAIRRDCSTKPLFLNSVSISLQKITTAENVIRINGWNGFLERSSWEVAGKMTDECLTVLKALNKNVIPVPDEPGFISARIISMIINEAYFAKGENVSTEKEIDIAMKLGTNYPYGPFEWASKIGIKNIYSLLKTLSETDTRYKPSPLLELEAMKIS